MYNVAVHHKHWLEVFGMNYFFDFGTTIFDHIDCCCIFQVVLRLRQHALVVATSNKQQACLPSMLARCNHQRGCTLNCRKKTTQGGHNFFILGNASMTSVLACLWLRLCLLVMYPSINRAGKTMTMADLVPFKLDQHSYSASYTRKRRAFYKLLPIH